MLCSRLNPYEMIGDSFEETGHLNAFVWNGGFEMIDRPMPEGANVRASKRVELDPLIGEWLQVLEILALSK